MAICQGCDVDKAAYLLFDGLCADCRSGSRDQLEPFSPAASNSTPNHPRRRTFADKIVLTTEAAPNLPIDRRLDIITAEVVIGMHLFKDIAGVFRDVFGGRSKLMQEGLRDARKTALDELRREAATLGADAVVGVDLDYSEISGGGKSMLFLVASGTAVTLKRED